MSTRLARGLLEHLVDDAAVFPPGNAPVSRAVAEYLAPRPYAAFVGPLLVPASAATQVLEAAAGRALTVALVDRPDLPGGRRASSPADRSPADRSPADRSPADRIRGAVARLAGSPVHVVGLEVPWARGWRELLDLEIPVTVEIPRVQRDDALGDVADARADVLGKPPVRAKFRTGATSTRIWPSEGELAAFIRAAIDLEVPVKFTGGLHHALRGEDADGPHHGVLNVLAAVWQADNFGTTPDVSWWLEQRQPRRLVEELLTIGPIQARGLRHTFTSFGCCAVLDPLRELVALGLVEAEQ